MKKELRLNFCLKCFQMTNHIDNECQKCKVNESEKYSMKTMNIKKRIKDIVVEYIGATPVDKHFTTWAQLQDSMVADILDVVEGEPLTEENPTVDDHYYILSGFVGNAMLWWAHDSKGYTTDFENAGKYNKEDALEIINDRPLQDSAWLCSYIDNRKDIQKVIIESINLDTEFKLKETKK